jgi:diguanylate cyclase (GGDEF)-like protein
MERQDLVKFLEYSGKDPSRLIFEDELTGIYNRRFLLHYLRSKISWNHLAEQPVSLIMLDLDYFKQINDNYGHEAGDRALIWIASLLKNIAGQQGLPIRYAGDEFMILMPQSSNEASLKLGLHLLQQVRENPFQLDEQNESIKITISLGIASAPDDARNGKSLIRQADTALYSAKKNGRDRLVNATEVNPEEVFAKTAIYQLGEIKIVGRGRQLAVVADALKKFSMRQSQFIIAEGAAGMGKSEFLEAIRHNLARSKTRQAKVTGISQEMFRPYYLAVKIIIAILNQREDKGKEELKNLTPKELAYLSRILPQIGADEAILADEDDSTRREGIFTTLVRFIPKIINSRPLVLFIDDLHFSDEASLLLLRRLIINRDNPIFVCSTAMATEETIKEGQSVPLDRFYADHNQDLGIRKFKLESLTHVDIAKHMHGLFPNVRMPKNFTKDLAEITNGNPLFANEILRKLVLDQKITLMGQQWVVQSVEEGYLPMSLEEIVTQKIAALDEDSRQVLDQVSALGEDVSLSMLIGSSAQMEAKVLEFIDKAASQGLLKSAYQFNDEVVRFLGKRILDITYGAIEPKRKEEIHQRIGNYHESLYQQQILPSAATLAYHFKRSSDKEKAGNYERILAASNSRNFNAEEAVLYSGEELVEDQATDVPLNPEDITLVPKFIRDFMVAVRNIKLYPPGSKSIVGGIRQSKESLEKILENNEILNLSQIKQALVVNGQKMDISEFKVVAEGFLQFLNRYDLKGIAFKTDLTESEMEVLVEAFGRTQQKMFDEHFWVRFSRENQLEHIELKQMRYAMRGKKESTSPQREIGNSAESDPKKKDTGQPSAGLDYEDLRLIPGIFKGLLGASRIIKLYPLKSKAVYSAIDQLMETLRSFFIRQKLLTLSNAGHTLLVNGERIDISGFKKFAVGFLKFLDHIGLTSLTFLENMNIKELEIFIGALGDLPAEGVEGEFWKNFVKTQELTGILFDKHIYDIRVAKTPGDVQTGSGLSLVETMIPVTHISQEEPIPEENFEDFLAKFSDSIREWFHKGEQVEIQQATIRLYLGFQERDLPIREKVINICRGLQEGLAPAIQIDFAKFLTAPLLDAFSKENDPQIIVEMAALLNRLVVNLIQFVEYPLAARILSHLQRRHQQLMETQDPRTQMLTKSLEIRLNPATEKLLVADLKSGESSRQRNAAHLLESLGQVSIPLLIDIIKQEDDYRARQTAATLLEKQGPKAVERLKRLLVLEITPEERSRILDVIDVLTGNLMTELVHALGDENSQVRLAAFRLAERLKDPRVTSLILNSAKTLKGELAIAAVNTLGKLRPPEAIEELISLLNSTKEEDLCVACCRALGQIAKPECIGPLAQVLNKKSLIFRRHQFGEQVRATAAFALGQITHQEATETLATLLDDPDHRIRGIAQSVIKTAQSAPRQKKVEVSVIK